MEEMKSRIRQKAGSGKYEIDMCNGPLLGKLLLFTLPLMASSMLQLLFNAADIIVVGKFSVDGDSALAAVGSNTPLINLLVNFFIGLSVGANVLVARYYAAKKEQELRETVHTAMLIGFISGIFLTIVGIVGARQILVWMSTPAEILDLAALYLRVYFVGMTAMMIYNFGAAVLRAVGDTRRPLFFLMIAGVINVLLNLLFVIVFQMSVVGVGLATVISQCVSAGLILICLFRERGSIRLEIHRLRINKAIFWRILQIGLPASLQGTLFAISNVIIQSSVNTFGDIVVAGNSAAANIEGFVYVAMNSFYQAAISFTSQNLGAGRLERITKILFRAQICVIVVGLVLGNLVAAFGEPLLGLYSDNPKVVEAGIGRLDVISRTYALCGMMDVMVGCLRGLGYSVMPMIVSLIGACGLRLLWIFTMFQTERFHSLFSLYMTYPVSWLITVSVHIICFVVVWSNMKKRLSSGKRD